MDQPTGEPTEKFDLQTTQKMLFQKYSGHVGREGEIYSERSGYTFTLTALVLIEIRKDAQNDQYHVYTKKNKQLKNQELNS